MQTSKTTIAQRSQQQTRFSHQDMDYYYAWILGRQVYEGSDAEECARAADRIRDGDAVTWECAWLALAEQVEQQARAALGNNEPEKARRAYLRACTYYRALLFMMHPGRDVFFQLAGRMRHCFRQAAALHDPPIQTFEIPFRGAGLPGYYWPAEGGGQPRPTLLIVGGLETFVEDCLFMVGPRAAEEGYNLISVDLPGQGLTPEQGLYLEARMGPAISVLVDAALSRPGVDPKRLVLFGFSWGGHIVFKGAQHDRRIRALVANPAMPDLFRAALAQQSSHGRGDPIAQAVFGQIAWRMGLRISLRPRDLLRRFAKAYDYLAYGRANPRAIACPTLCLAGEGEAPVTLRIARECYDRLPHPDSELIVFTRAQGGEAHCQVDRLDLPNSAMFAWLDGVLGPTEA